MIHYKKTFIGDGSGMGIPNFELGGQGVAEFFTKNNMLLVRDGYVSLAELIATNLGLNIFKNIHIFECDGMDELVNYVYDGSDNDIAEISYE